MFKETKKERNIELENIFEVLPLFLIFLKANFIIIILEILTSYGLVK